MTNLVIAVRLVASAPAQAGPGPSAMWVGNVDSFRVTFSWWPPADITVEPDSYNVYRRDFSDSVPLARGIVYSANKVPQLLYVDKSGLTAGTAYTYWVTAVTGDIESKPGPLLHVTTLAAGPGASDPDAPTVPATYLPAAPVSYSNFYGNSNNVPLTNLAQLTAACASNGAQPGQTVVVAAGTVMASAAYPGLSVACSGTAGNYINIISSEDPVFKAGGKLPAYSYTTTNKYSTFTLASLPPASVAGTPTLTATLSVAWAARSGYFPCVFYTNAPPAFETRLVHFTQGSTAISWEAGYQGANTLSGVAAGGLLGAATSTTILVHVGNYVTPDEIGSAMPTLFFSSPSGANDGIQVTGSYIRFVGINVQPHPNQPANNTGSNCVTITGNNVVLDRCVIGNDSGLTSWAPMLRGVQASGNNIIGHQCFIYGIHTGIPTLNVTGLPKGPGGDTQGWWSAANGPHLIQNCYVEATAENFFSGGVYIGQAAIPHDITVRYCYSHKNGAWNGSEFGAYLKNHHELKYGLRYDIYGNIYQNCWWSFGGGGQNGRCFVIGTLDQVSAITTRANNGAPVWSGGRVTATAANYGFGTAPGQTLFATIAGVSNAAYNGRFLITIQSFSGANCTYSYALPVNPGPAGSSGTVSTSTIMLNPWVETAHINVHDNQIYGVATAWYGNSTNGDQASGHAHHMRFANNLCWINPAGRGALWPGSKNDSGIVQVGDPISQGHALNIQYFTPDHIIDHNTTIVIAKGTGYLDTLPGAATDALQAYTFGRTSATTTQEDRCLVTNNFLDGGNGFNATNIVGGDWGASGPTAVPLWFHNPGWTNNVTIGTDVRDYTTLGAGNVNHIAYAAIFSAGFVSNTTMPVSPESWNATQAPYITGSSTGGPIGAIF